MSLPKDLVEYLDSKRTLEYDALKCECGQVVLHLADSIATIELRLNSYQTRWADEDPHADDAGSYIVPAYDLIASCDGFDPTGLLVYVHSQNAYGTHDSDHGDLRTFPRLTWWNIVADPLLYLNALWYPTRGVGKLVIPIGDYEFRADA